MTLEKKKRAKNGEFYFFCLGSYFEISQIFVVFHMYLTGFSLFEARLDFSPPQFNRDERMRRALFV